MQHMDAEQVYGEKAWRQLHKNFTEQILKKTSHKAKVVRPPTTNLKNHPN